MEKLYFINGSPRGKNSASKLFIEELYNIIQSKDEIKEISLNDKLSYEDIATSDIIVITFPLYVDSLPSSVIEFLSNLEHYAESQKKSTRVYAIVNCGFYEGNQTKHALQILKNFCKRAGFEWRFGIGIGAGEFMKNTKEIIPLNSPVKQNIYEAFIELRNDINSCSKDNKENIFISPIFPKSEFILAASKGWIETAKSMSLNEEDLYARPFLE